MYSVSSVRFSLCRVVVTLYDLFGRALLTISCSHLSVPQSGCILAVSFNCLQLLFVLRFLVIVVRLSSFGCF